MIPWIESHTFNLGSVVIQTWGSLVAIGFVVATWIAARRAKLKSLDPKLIWDMAFWIFVAAIIGARLFHVFFYDFNYYLAHPLDAIDPRQPGFAIMGGLLSGAAVVWFYTKRKGLDFLAYADTLAWGLPWGCGIGRIGCFLIHDHPGTLTSFTLGVKYPDGKIRHDLGLYLSIVGFVIGLSFLILNRRHRRPGFWVGMFLILDGVSRFALDFLRLNDRRLFLLTPTQWILILSTALGFRLVWSNRNLKTNLKREK